MSVASQVYIKACISKTCISTTSTSQASSTHYGSGHLCILKERLKRARHQRLSKPYQKNRSLIQQNSAVLFKQICQVSVVASTHTRQGGNIGKALLG
jgi:hypothetical protein